MARRRAIAVGAGLLILSAPAGAQDTQAMIKAVEYSLQCNASVGVIENVALSGVDYSADRAMATIRGTYRQQVAVLRVPMVQTPGSGGGVFEGVYNVARRRLDSLHYKISIKGGPIPPHCLP